MSSISRQQDDQVWRHESFMAGCVILFGITLRLASLFHRGALSTHSTGGLFFEFSEQIAAHHYALPRLIPFFTEGGIPFAYPPLPFYLQALLIHLLGLPALLVVNGLPVLAAALSVPSFYLLARQAGLDPAARLAALLAFATLPNAFGQQIRGAGLPAAFGTLSLIWFAYFLLRSWRAASIGNALLSGVGWALCIFCSPGSALGSLPMFATYAVGRLGRAAPGDRLHSSLAVLLSGVVALILSSAYWMPVAANHGLGVFIGAFRSWYGGVQDWLFGLVSGFFSGSWTSGSYPFLWNLLIALGLCWSALKMRGWLPIWFLVFLGIPRDGSWMIAIPAALLAGIGAMDFFLPAMQHVVFQRRLTGRRFAVSSALLGLGGLMLVANLGGYLSKLRQPEPGLTPGVLEGMTWIKENSPGDSRWVVLAAPAVQEWLPQISRRTVLNMPYGAEWQPEEQQMILVLEAELAQCADLGCVLRVVQARTGCADPYFLLAKPRLERLIDAAPGGALEPLEVIFQNAEVALLAAPPG